MNLTLKIWRQANADATGSIETYPIENVSPDMSFLEMMDVLNEQLIGQALTLLPLIMTAEKGFVECALCT